MQYPGVWRANGLLDDTFKLIAVPFGGALALSQNMVIYYTQVRTWCWCMLRQVGFT